MYPGSAAISSGITCDTTCKPASASPASAPMAAAASMPRSPPVFGTMTLLTFLMILPLAATSISDGSIPKAFLATAAQYAIAIGSVHPIAHTSSRFKIST